MLIPHGAGQALAGRSTFARNLTLLAAASNLIVVAAERRGIHLSLIDFVRFAAPLAAVTLATLTHALRIGA